MPRFPARFSLINSSGKSQAARMFARRGESEASTQRHKQSGEPTASGTELSNKVGGLSRLLTQSDLRADSFALFGYILDHWLVDAHITGQL